MTKTKFHVAKNKQIVKAAYSKASEIYIILDNKG